MSKTHDIVLMEVVGATYQAQAKVMELADIVASDTSRKRAEELMFKIHDLLRTEPPIAGIMASVSVLWAMVNALNTTYLRRTHQFFARGDSGDGVGV